MELDFVKVPSFPLVLLPSSDNVDPAELKRLRRNALQNARNATKRRAEEMESLRLANVSPEEQTRRMQLYDAKVAARQQKGRDNAAVVLSKDQGFIIPSLPITHN